MASDEIAQQQQQKMSILSEIGPISWWSWRPGIKARQALAIGGLISLVALLFLGIGLITLVLGIIDAYLPPLSLPGTVLSHSRNIENAPLLTIRLQTKEAGFPPEVSSTVSENAFRSIQNGNSIFVEYSPHLHFLYALESSGQRYDVPGVSAVGNPLGSIVLLLLGGVFLPYPAVLVSWAWRDLLTERKGKQAYQNMHAQVVSLRNTSQTRIARPGLTPRPTRSWYGVALLPSNPNITSSPVEVITFSINQQMYTDLKEGAVVDIAYSPQLHYVYTLEILETRETSA